MEPKDHLQPFVKFCENGTTYYCNVFDESHSHIYCDAVAETGGIYDMKGVLVIEKSRLATAEEITKEAYLAAFDRVGWD